VSVEDVFFSFIFLHHCSLNCSSMREIKLYGLVYLQWMYLVEQYMKILKRYTKNIHRSEASIVERYIAEEAIEFCS